jgi:hypothetical protein
MPGIEDLTSGIFRGYRKGDRPSVGGSGGPAEYSSSGGFRVPPDAQPPRRDGDKEGKQVYIAACKRTE